MTAQELPQIAPDPKFDVPLPGFATHLALMRGRLWQRTLVHAEQFAYDVAGLPMALSARAKLDPANYLHSVYRRHFWRLPGGPVRGLVATATWPFALVFTIFQNTARNGAAIRSRTDKSITGQILGQLHCAARHAIAPPWYYMFELFDDERSCKASLYLTAHETIAAAYDLLEPRAPIDQMADKVWFADHCRKAGIAAVPVLFHASRGRIHYPGGGDNDPPKCDLFVKPRQGNGGHNSERWDFIGSGRYRNSKGESLDGAFLTQRIARQSLARDFVVQPRLINHSSLADISNDALATVRVLTCRNESGGFEATNVAFRMAIGSNSVVDNFHQGGLAAAVELASGRIGSASDMGKRPDVGWRDIHPVSGARFAGRILPYWSEVIDIACRAHATLPHRTAVGWDVAMLANGPCIIEGNGKPDLDIHQRVERRPLGDQRIGELLAFNLRRGILNKS